MKTRGSAVDAGIMLERWMNECPDLGPVKFDTKWIPLGPWESGANEEETRIKVAIGTLMRQNMKEFAKSLVPSFIASGYAPELLERFFEGSCKELDELRFHMYLRYHHCWARRISKPEGGAGLDVATDTGHSPHPDTTADPPELATSIPSIGTPHPPPPPPSRAVRVEWKVNPETGETFLDNESLIGSIRSMGTASMSISSASSVPKQ